ncbi:MAG: AAA family ATPase [Bacteroidales bacterium]|nr:AAA family ATPase [Bacteroidales bacterium]
MDSFFCRNVKKRYRNLSRPRRFGKSLLSTTLKSYFEGRRDLFEGLKMMEYEKEWKSYPVIHLDLSTAKDMGNAAKLRTGLKDILEDYCTEYEVNVKSRTPGQCLKRIILSAYKKHESKVAVLIDEYDAPLLDVLHDNDRLEDMRSAMREFFQRFR